MNEAQARSEGLQYEGGYAQPWNREECYDLLKRADDIRKKGFRAVVVQSGKNEWGGGAKLLYVDEDYATYKYLLQDMNRSDEQLVIEAAQRECDRIMDKARKEQEELDKRVADRRARLVAAGFENLEGVKKEVKQELMTIPCRFRDGDKCRGVDGDNLPMCAFLIRDGGKCGCVKEG